MCVFLPLCVPCAITRQIHMNDVPDLISYSLYSFTEYFLITYALVSLVYLSCLNFLYVEFLPFTTNISTKCTKSRKHRVPSSKNPDTLWVLFLGILLTDTSYDVLIAWFFHVTPNLIPLIETLLMMLFQIRSHFSLIYPLLLTLTILSSAMCPASHLFSLVTIHIFCSSLTKKVPPRVPLLLILLANDIELNPGPLYHENFFSFMNWNLNSIVKNNFERVQLLEAHNSLHNYDIISICETSLNNSTEIPDPLLNEYTFLSANHPDNVSHGGVGLFYKNSLPLKHRKDLSFDETIVVELKFGRKKIFFTVVYRSPSVKYNSPDFEGFLQNFKTLHINIQAENPYANFYTGDFNGHSQNWWTDGDTTPEGKKIDEMFFELNLSQVISEPTNFTPGKNPSCIDLIVTDQPNLILNSGTRPSLDPKCHHQIIHGKVNFKIPPPPPSERKVWHYNKANTDAIKKSLSSFPWARHLSINADINWQVKQFQKIFLNIMSNFIPNDMKKFTPRDSPWINKSLKSLLKKKDKMYRNYKKHGYKEEDKIRLDSIRTECNESISAAKLTYLDNLGKDLNESKSTSKNYWKIIHRVMNKSRAPKIPPILHNGNFVLNCSDKAKLFNDFFAKQCTLMLNDSILPDFNFITETRIDSIAIKDEDILLLIRKLNPNKASGSDGISTQMLLISDESVVLPLKIIFRNILDSSVYPDLWKIADVTPIFKKEDKQLVKNYRPISLLPICGKIFEKLIFNSLYSYLSLNNLITKNQSGFVPGDSCTNQLLFLINEIHEAFENNSLEVRAVFLDISKAFDKVWHDGLIFKLRRNGVSGKLLKFFESYLHNRKQRVVLNGFYSEYAAIESGVPQGSVLGPLLFLVYINDLENNILSNVKFFADDTMLYSVVHNPEKSAFDLNHDLEMINQWAHQWKMAFNPDPNKQANEILFSCKKKAVNHPQLVFNGSPVLRVDEHKHLGLILTPTLNFAKHIAEKVKKAKRNIGIMKHLNKFLPIKTLIHMYKALVRSHLDYCDIVYHIPPTSHDPPFGISLHDHMETIEKTQYQAALAVTGAWQGTSRIKLYEELGWESLSDRRMCKRMLQLHKIIDDQTPEYLRNKLPQNRNVVINLPNVFHEIKCRTNRYKNSFFPNAISTWNNIIGSFQSLPSFEDLKRHILSLVRPPPKETFSVFNPTHLRYLFQLRLGLSRLRYHKKRHNFQDTPSDICLCKKGVEDTKHFLLTCPFYANHREALFSTVENIIQNKTVDKNSSHLFLYGDPSLSISENQQIICATLDYIDKTNRLSFESA